MPSDIVRSPAPSAFLSLMASVGDGSLESEASEIVKQLVAKLKEIGDSGGKPKAKIAVTIAIKYDRQVFEVDAEIKTMEPKVVRPRTMMYAIPGGGLSRNNPQQIDAFRQVEPAPQAETRAVSLA